jgi:nucleoside-diphosphate-sugar epimerase
MRTVITGGAGFIGTSLAGYLLQQCAENDEIFLVDSLGRHGTTPVLESLQRNRKVRFVKADLADPSSVALLPDKPDRVYHFAGIVGVSDVVAAPARVMLVNTLIAANVFHWFVEKAAPNGRLLYASTSEVYSGNTLAGFNLPIPTPETVPAVIHDPKNPRMSYAISKLWGEMYGRFLAEATERFVATVRYHNVYGPAMGYSHVIPQVISRVLRRESPFRIIGATETRSFCWIGDAVRATVLTLESSKLQSGDLVHIGDPDCEVTVQELYNRIFDLLKWRPDRVAFEPSAPGSVPRRCPDTSLLNSITGFKATMPLSAGLCETVAWYRDNLQ